VPAGVDPKSTYEIGMLEFHDLDGESHHSAVQRSVLAVAVRIDRDVCGITVLVLAVTRSPPDPAVMIRRAKP
jgi:hypothetical protein